MVLLRWLLLRIDIESDVEGVDLVKRKRKSKSAQLELIPNVIFSPEASGKVKHTRATMAVHDTGMNILMTWLRRSSRLNRS